MDGSYGIGVSRVMACIAETHHDEKGLAWPAVIAPAQVHVVATGKDAAAFEAAEQLIGELEAKGIEVIFDDRKKVSPGVKFKDAELIGVPIIAVAGRDTVTTAPSKCATATVRTPKRCRSRTPRRRSRTASLHCSSDIRQSVARRFDPTNDIRQRKTIKQVVFRFLFFMGNTVRISRT